MRLGNQGLVLPKTICPDTIISGNAKNTLVPGGKGSTLIAPKIRRRPPHARPWSCAASSVKVSRSGAWSSTIWASRCDSGNGRSNAEWVSACVKSIY